MNNKLTCQYSFNDTTSQVQDYEVAQKYIIN